MLYSGQLNKFTWFLLESREGEGEQYLYFSKLLPSSLEPGKQNELDSNELTQPSSRSDELH